MSETYSPTAIETAKAMLNGGSSVSKIARTLGGTRSGWEYHLKPGEKERKLAYKRRTYDAAQAAKIKARRDKKKHDNLTYLVAGGDKVKIGETTNLANRLSAMQVNSPVPLTLLGTTSIPESDLHQRWSHCRAHGEWFDWCQDMQVFVDAL
jgi:hypothetical protein